MNENELRDLVALLQNRSTDLAEVEAKAAVGGLPKSVRETLSAFSNDRGGVVILGLDESAGFTPAVGFDAVRMRDALASACHGEMEPPIRTLVDIVEFDHAPLVVAEIPEMDPRFKPCFVKARGEYNGSFTRGGDGDRRLTDFEIHLLHTNRGQPDDDRTGVPGATMADLDEDAVAALLRRVRRRQQRAFAGVDDMTALQRLNVMSVTVSGEARPTLAGLLALGVYPQQFFPQLNMTFVVYPGLSSQDVPQRGPRFLDNRSFDGPIPAIVEDALGAVIRNMAFRSFVDGAGRQDVPDYPVEALREAIVNALVHRDYSPYSQGAPIQIVMYADRLSIANPGGLFGAVTEDDLGGEGVTASRNPVLVKLLQDVQLADSDRTVCENRGSGIPTIFRELRRAGAALPEFHNRITRFKVILPKHALLSTEVVRWIAQLGAEDLTSTQHMALALMRDGRTVTNQVLRNLGLDSRRATTELGDLVTRGLTVRIGERRHAHYVLAAPLRGGDTASESERQATNEELVLRALASGRELSRVELMEATQLRQATLLRVVRALISSGRIEPTTPGSSPSRRYRLVKRLSS